MKILFLSSEVAPFAKTGGLADVAGSLPLALGKLGHDVIVVMPRYRGIALKEKKISDRVTVHFIENEPLYNRAGLYGNEKGDYPDNLERFRYFSTEALELVKRLKFQPDIVHANDWQSALVPVLLKTVYSNDPFFSKTRSLLTVHNLAYQGVFPADQYAELGLPETLFSVDGFEFWGKVSLLKGGLLLADGISTVSPTYAMEIQTRECGAGMEGVVKQRTDRLVGILNGIDIDEWNPATDKKIKANFSAVNPAGKAACKKDLQESCGFEADAAVPVFGMVSRLVEQKGLDLLSEICDKLLEKRAQLVLLGEGDRVYHTTFKNVAARHPKNVAVHLGFEAAEAHKIYAGSDFFLMPSIFEPCGLGQLISLRYGTLPIVRETGGLADTIIDADEDEVRGSGFSFAERSPERFLKAIERAITAFEDKKRFAELRLRALKADFSWTVSAKEYEKYYERLLRS